MEGGNDAGEKMVSISEPIASDVAATLNQPQADPSETGEQHPIAIVDTLGPTYRKVVEGALQRTQQITHDLRVNQSRLSEQGYGNIENVPDSWIDDEGGCQTSSHLTSHRKPGVKPMVNNVCMNIKLNDVELGHAGSSGQVSRKTKGVHDFCPDDETDCQASGQLQLSGNLDNKATTNFISRDVERNHPSTVSATAAEAKRGGLDALKKINHPTPRSFCRTNSSDAVPSATISVANEISSGKVPMDLT